MTSADRTCWFVHLSRAGVRGTAELTNSYKAFVPSFLRFEILYQNLEHGTDKDMISLGEHCCRRSTECVHQIHHYCISSLVIMGILGCIFFPYFIFIMNRTYIHLVSGSARVQYSDMFRDTPRAAGHPGRV